MRLRALLAFTVAALLGVAAAASPTPATVPVNATVEDICEITGTTNISFEYQAATLTPAAGNGTVGVHCNQDTAPFIGYWDDTQWNANGSLDLNNGSNKLNVTLGTDVDPTSTGSGTAGSFYTYGISATAPAGQWTAPTGAYSAVVDYYIGW